MRISRRTLLKVGLGIVGTSLIRPRFARAANPKVIKMWDTNCTTWNGSDAWFGADTYVDQTAVDAMVKEGVKKLTGQTTELGAWTSIIPTYAAGTKIAIKLNFNNYGALGNYSNPTPQVVNSIISGLKVRGVAEGDIWVTDPSRSFDERFTALIHDHYPGVYHYTYQALETHSGANMVAATHANGDPSLTVDFEDTGLADKVVWDGLLTATYLIHVPIMRVHGGCGLTLTYKNLFGMFQYGTIGVFHDHYPQASENPVIDMWANSNIGTKSRLIIGDGIYGNYSSNITVPTVWSIFGNAWPKSLFFSTDPVAIDSVMYDYLYWQNPSHANLVAAHSYLAEAMIHGQGIHGHWNNTINRVYTGIDFLEYDMDDLPSDIPSSVQGLTIQGGTLK